jgi:hypothetical protein
MASSARAGEQPNREKKEQQKADRGHDAENAKEDQSGRRSFPRNADENPLR